MNHPDPWRPASVSRVFISHSPSLRATAVEINEWLGRWGLDGFLARNGPQRGTEQVDATAVALDSCHALVALLHDGFRGSDWCDQEVGVAVGRGVPVIPVRIGVNPYGFLTTVPAIPWPTAMLPEPKVARSIVARLLADERTEARVVDAIVRRVATASTYGHASELVTFLAASGAAVGPEHLARLRAAQRDNRHVREAVDVEPALEELEGRLRT